MQIAIIVSTVLLRDLIRQICASIADLAVTIDDSEALSGSMDTVAHPTDQAIVEIPPAARKGIDRIANLKLLDGRPLRVLVMYGVLILSNGVWQTVRFSG